MESFSIPLQADPFCLLFFYLKNRPDTLLEFLQFDAYIGSNMINYHALYHMLSNETTDHSVK